jgi:hypothetical protein
MTSFGHKRALPLVKARGLKLKLAQGPHWSSLRARGPQSNLSLQEFIK